MYSIILPIIDYRYAEEKITILTSNMAPNILSSVLQDDRIVRRIEETYQIIEKKHWKNK
jgi:DNA replication protein DnaC